MELQLHDDPGFYRKEWRAQHIGWVCIMIIVVAAALGLTGRGPLGQRMIQMESGRVQYDRILRSHSPGSVTLWVRTPDLADSVLGVWTTSSFQDACNLQNIQPSPSNVVSHGDTTYWQFPVTSSARLVRISIACQPVSFGSHVTAIGVDGGSSATLRMFVLP